MAADAQDQAEVYDETNITEDGQDIAHPDIERDVFDVTALGDDAEEDDEADDAFDPDEIDDRELEVMLESDDGVDEPGDARPDDAARVATDDAGPAEYESETTVEADRASSPPPSPRAQRRLDEGLEETFPASDPTSINPGSD